MKYTVINQTKDVQNLYVENYKTDKINQRKSK